MFGHAADLVQSGAAAIQHTVSGWNIVSCRFWKNTAVLRLKYGASPDWYIRDAKPAGSIGVTVPLSKPAQGRIDDQ